MAIRGKEEEKKNGMKITDNMDGESKADKKLQAKYEPGSNISDFKYERYKKAIRDDNVKEIFPDESIFELRKMFDRMMKETGIPNGLNAVGYSNNDLDALTEKSYVQKRLIDNAPLPISKVELKEIFRDAMSYWQTE